MTKPSALSYRPVAIILHWLVALFVISTVPAGIIMLEEGLARSVQDRLFIFHKNIGVVIFLLVIARIVFRAFNPPPPLPSSIPVLQRHVASATHIGLYGLLLIMTISGYVYVIAGGFPIEGLDAIGVPHLVPEDEGLSKSALSIHLAARFVLIALVFAHVGAALYHWLIRRDGVFERMAPMLRRSSQR
ncbi:cytochrome b [Devosia pacifica]|uniref:Cytochrome b n=1 Tax=Devosia pacifica TaxID=1335967 RepID=A0A918SD53_9HYPH|nr:cytochrome b [Devosia pacifica]GHA32949.1 cytochrome b [Devosia pacifica]